MQQREAERLLREAERVVQEYELVIETLDGNVFRFPINLEGRLHSFQLRSVEFDEES